MLTRDLLEAKDFMDEYISQLTPRMVRNVYTMNEQPLHVLTGSDKAKMLADYNDVRTHGTGTLLDIFGPLLK